jgi:hypothetical protein
MKGKRSKKNKDMLLEDELYKLDGRSGERVAEYIDNIIEKKI